MAAIKSTFVGNHAIIWEPMTPAPQQAPTNDQTERFDAFLKAELEKCKNKTGEYHGKSTLWRADRTKHMLALQAVLCDPSPSLAISGSTNDFDEPFVNNLAGIRTLMATWSNKPPEDIRREAAWTKATSKADKVVPSWYGMQCSITSIKIYDAAQIVDLQAFKGIGEESLTVWRHLRVFWPALDKIQTFDIFGKELENILPLSPTAYRLWQTNKLGLRPIPHPHDPKSIYLQVVWFQNYHNDIGWSKPLSGCQYILHGDVYEFRTTSATTRPLPNLRFLQLRYAVQKLFAGVQAAVEALEKPSGREEEPPNVTNSEPSRGEEEPPNVTNSEPSGGEEEPPNDTNSDAGFGAWPRQGLECIFSMGVPELPEGPEPPDESYMPRDWDWMLDEAWMRGILDESSEAWWRKCILKQAYLDWCKAMAARQALVDEMGPNGGEEEE